MAEIGRFWVDLLISDESFTLSLYFVYCDIILDQYTEVHVTACIMDEKHSKCGKLWYMAVNGG